MKRKAKASGTESAKIQDMDDRAWEALLAEDPSDRMVRAMYLATKEVVKALNGVCVCMQSLEPPR